MRKVTRLLTATFLCALSPTVLAQWPKFPLAGTPKTADGKVNMTAPTPRAADGKPDLSGVWETIPGRRPPGPQIAAEGTGELPPSGSIFGNIGDQISGGAPYQPWAAELVKKRMADNSKDNPDAHCLPMGIMQMTSHPYPEEDHPDALGGRDDLRRIRHDGPRDLHRRPAAAEGRPQPWWNGYSVGRWEGDTLVVETTGFMDDGWLDVRGQPADRARAR